LKIRTTTYTMNLLVNKNYFAVSGLAFLLIPFFFACDDPTQLGLELDAEESPLNSDKIEFVLPSSNIRIDSLRTDDFELSVFGQFSDSIYGTTKAISYNDFNFFGGVIPEGDSLEYSSVYLNLSVSDLRSHGILSGEKIAIHLAKDSLYINPVYLASMSVDYDPIPVGELTFDFDPSKDSIIRVPLNDDFGLFLYDRLEKAKVAGDYRDSLFQGLYHYAPLALVPGASNEGMFLFDLNAEDTKLVIEMSTVFGKVYTFEFDFNDAHFSQIIRDNSTGKLNDISMEYTESNVPSSRVYLDMIAGINPKLALAPYIDFLKTNNDFIINRATLTMGVANDNDQIENVSSIRALFIKSNGKINGTGILLGDGFNNAILSEAGYTSSANTSNVLNMGIDAANSEVKVDVTLFAQLMADYYRNNSSSITDELVLWSPNTVGLGQTSFIKNEIKLTLYYTTIKN
jgi:hypothetical protein